MKPSTALLALALAGLTGLAVPPGLAAPIDSLRGDLPITATEPAPALFKYINDKENIPRNFEEQPPLVPHTTEKYPINLTENGCLKCHMEGAAPGEDEDEDSKSVPMSESHYVDRNGVKQDKPVGSRHFCTQCHVPQADAEPLVENTFQAALTK
jgi:cytochrome c-type protein NapB